MDRLEIRNLEVFARHGVHGAEKTLGQKFLVSIAMLMDLHGAGSSDELGATADYAAVCDMAVAIMRENSYSLIEACAESVASGVLGNFQLVREVTVEITKPHAPIRHPLGHVAASVSRRREDAYIGIGSNIGDRAANLDGAVSALSALPHLKVKKVSAYRETKAVGPVPQPDYLNAVVMAEATCPCEALMEKLLALEIRLGRERPGAAMGPRTIDLDLLLFGDAVTDSQFVTLPHPRLHERLFVLEPLCELNPHLIHPLMKKRVSELRRSV